MKKPIIAALLSTIAAMYPAAAAAQCVTVDPAVTPNIRVDPLDASGAAQLVQPLALTFRRVGVGTEPLTIAYQIIDEDSPVQSRVGLSTGPQIEWRSNDSGRNIGAYRNEAYALLRSGTVSLGAAENSKQADIRIFFPNLRDDLPAGVYREQFAIRYWCADVGTALPNEIPGIVAVTVQVPNVLSANIAGASTRGEIDFLDFSTLSRSLSIHVRSTGRYAVSARSLNGKVMLREGATAAGEADRIAYSLRFGGRDLSLDGQQGLTNSRAGLDGQRIPLDVTAEDVGSKRAGVYRDTLILTLAPVS